MSEEPSSINHTFDANAFVLTAGKLARILEVAREKIEKIGGPSYVERFEITLRSGKEISLNSFESTVRLDNSVRNPITNIQYHIWDRDKGQNSIFLKFGSQKYSPIVMFIEAGNVGWMQEAAGALEEQIERVIADDIAYRFGSGGGVAFAAAAIMPIIIGSLLAISTYGDSADKIGQSELKNQLLPLLRHIKSSDDKLNFVYEYSRAMVTAQAPRQTILDKVVTDFHTYLIAVPVFIALAAALVALKFFYPRWVFSWGDFEDHYNKVLERRKAIWYGVIIALVVGILGNLFVFGVTPYLSPR